MSNKHAIWTCFRCFPCFLRPGSFTIKGANAKNACIGSADSTYTRDAYAELSCDKGAGGVSAVKSLGIHLQSSQILELRQYSTILETGVRTG